MFGFFKKREEVFHKLIQQQASITYDGVKLLVKYFETQDKEVAEELALKEKEADEVRRILIDELNRTFVTPFDREDIFSLSREIDDVLDYANTTVDEMEILEVLPTPYMARMAALLLAAAQEIELAVERRQEKHYSVAADHAQRAKSFENRVETVYREAIADLFRGPKNIKHVMTML